MPRLESGRHRLTCAETRLLSQLARADKHGSFTCVRARAGHGADVIGEKLNGRYEVVGELGRGGMGVVYRAHDPMLNRDVAVKLILRAMMTPEAEQRFRAEAQVVAQLDHPAIVPVYDFGRHGDSLFFVMPLVDGTSLRKLLRDQSLRLGHLLEIGIHVAAALAYSHARGVVHRDIKPENIMVTREGGELRVRVMDFGLARDSGSPRITRSGMLLGTMAYISPEQAKGLIVDGRSDLYSLGMVLYECVVGTVPFSGEMQAVLYRVIHEVPQTPRALGIELDEEFEILLLSCLAKDPERRPEKADRIVEGLRKIRGRLADSALQQSMLSTATLQTPRPVLAPFVGREREMLELQQRLNRTVGGESQFVVVSGAPGVGKTRLVDELEMLARARQIRVLHGRLVERDGSFPYFGFCEAIQEFFRQRDAGSASGLPDLSDVAADLVSLFPMLAEIEPIRIAASGGSQPSLRVGSRSPENQTQVFEVLALALIRLGRGSPLVLVLEDLHGAEASLEALQYVVRRLGPTPTLLVATYRSSEFERRGQLERMLEGFEGNRRFVALKLATLEPSEFREFLGTLVGGTRIAEDLSQRLWDISEGNPFFGKELVRSLLDVGSIQQDDTGNWTLSGGVEISSNALPTTIQQAVEKRVGRLPEALRSTLSVVSVMGKSFDFADLESLASDRDDLDDAVERLISEGLLEEDRRVRGDRLTFSSGMVREVLYGELSRRRRRTLHRKFAAILEERHAGRLERVYPQLVYHYAEGDESAKTVEYGLLNARKSLETFSAEEAIRSARTALDFLDEEWHGDKALEGEARLVLAAGLVLSGDLDASLRESGQAVRIFEQCGRADLAVEALWSAASTAWRGHRVEETRQWVERGLEVTRSIDAVEPRARLLQLASTLARLRGEQDRAETYLREVEKLAPQESEVLTEEPFTEGGRLVVALGNPLSATSPAEIRLVEESEAYANVYETLVKMNDDGTPTPFLCERWEMCEGGRVFRFVLRSNAHFADGSPLTAEDVRCSFESAIRASVGRLPSALAAIDGATELAVGISDKLSGFEILQPLSFEIRLTEPLAIYPALLTDGQTGISRQNPSVPWAVGTGPFRLTARDGSRVVLERNGDWWGGTPPHLDAVEFHHGLNASAIAGGLREGRFDLAGDLEPRELEVLLRDPRFRRNLVEAPRKTTYFCCFNALSGPVARHASVRRALAGVVRSTDLVWQALGRFAQPAAGLLPPGVLGHDPGRRLHPWLTEQAKATLHQAGVGAPILLKAAVHPLIQDRHGALLAALLAGWAELGVSVEIVTPNMDAYQQAWSRGDQFDVGLFRWGADYDDPDSMTHTLFHSRTGRLRTWFGSSESDALLERARVESRREVREGLYRKFESLLLDTGVLVPLFHDVDLRVTSPRVRGLRLRGTLPYVNYSELSKTEHEAPLAEAQTSLGGGVVRAPMAMRVLSLDPSLMSTNHQGEVLPCIYETLLRDAGKSRILPWLAESYSIEENGRRYRFRLRTGVRFHDGRRLTARDVRWSFERLLRNEAAKLRWFYSPIVGARELLEGGRTDLRGFRIHSAGEFTIDLDEPVSFFPALLCFCAAAIVPEGTEKLGANWREGAVGTGPFRVVSFDPGSRLELERNPTYWREGLPRSQGVVFTFGVTPAETLAGFRTGRFSVVCDLFPADVEMLRRDAEFAAGYREAPTLSTYYLALNTRRGPLVDLALRQRILRAIHVPRIVRQSLGSLAIPAHSVIPPGLLGYNPDGTVPAALQRGGDNEIELTMAVHPVFRGPYSAIYVGLEEALRAAGIRLRRVTETVEQFYTTSSNALADLVVGRWSADYPDADAFAQMLHSREGTLGQMCGDSELDRCIEAGRFETNLDVRHATYRQIEEIVAREARLLPLFHEQGYRFVRPEVEGLLLSYWPPVVAYDNLCIVG